MKINNNVDNVIECKRYTNISLAATEKKDTKQ